MLGSAVECGDPADLAECLLLFESIRFADIIMVGHEWRATGSGTGPMT